MNPQWRLRFLVSDERSYRAPIHGLRRQTDARFDLSAIDRCRRLDVQCDLAVAKRLRTVLTCEYVRLITVAVGK